MKKLITVALPALSFISLILTFSRCSPLASSMSKSVGLSKGGSSEVGSTLSSSFSSVDGMIQIPVQTEVFSAEDSRTKRERTEDLQALKKRSKVMLLASRDSQDDQMVDALESFKDSGLAQLEFNLDAPAYAEVKLRVRLHPEEIKQQDLNAVRLVLKSTDHSHWTLAIDRDDSESDSPRDPHVAQLLDSLVDFAVVISDEKTITLSSH